MNQRRANRKYMYVVWNFYIKKHPAIIISLFSLFYFVISYLYSVGYFSKLGVSLPSDKSSAYFILLEKVADIDFNKAENFISWKPFVIIFVIISFLKIISSASVNDFALTKCGYRKKTEEEKNAPLSQKASLILNGIIILFTSLVVLISLAVLSSYQTALVLVILIIIIFLIFPFLRGFLNEIKEFSKFADATYLLFILFGLSISSYWAGVKDASVAISTGFKNYPTLCWEKKDHQNKGFDGCRKLIFTSNDFFYVNDKKEYEAVMLLPKGDFYYTIKPTF